jgi:hypothetical protein
MGGWLSETDPPVVIFALSDRAVREGAVWSGEDAVKH